MRSPEVVQRCGVEPTRETSLPLRAASFPELLGSAGGGSGEGASSERQPLQIWARLGRYTEGGISAVRKLDLPANSTHHPQHSVGVESARTLEAHEFRDARRDSPLNQDTQSPGCLSVVIPVYNEQDTLEDLVARVRELGKALEPIELEVVAVDDGSRDDSRTILDRLRVDGLIDRVVLHEQNQGKGAALQSGFAQARGDWVVVQDADLEYDPLEIPTLLQPVLEGKADVVYGSRFQGHQPHRVLFFWHYVANRTLTLLSNMLTNLNLTDMETCYKLFRRQIITQITLREKRFGVEPEMTAKIAKIRGIRIYEVGISYSGRTYAEGKKIGWRDAISALRCIVRYNLFD